MSEPPVIYRPGTPDDSYTVFCILEETLADLVRRKGYGGEMSIDDPARLARMWDERKPLYDHLAQTGEQFWIAERAGEVLAFARSIRREDVRELTELFVRPAVQSSGFGRELLARTFAAEPGVRRSVIASPDVRAQVLYLRSGVHVRCPIYYFGREPRAVELDLPLDLRPVGDEPGVLDTIATFDFMTVGYRRDADHAWLLRERQGYFYEHGGRVVGYGYVGRRNGPFALTDAADFPAVLAHAERAAADAGRPHFGVEVPMANRVAVDYLLANGFRVDPFSAVLLADEPRGDLTRYIVTSPPFFI